MATVITTIEETDLVSNSRVTINDNFASLNTNKQEVEVGKGLSTNDFTTEYKDKLVDLVPNYSLTPDLVDNINNTLNEIAINGGGTLYLLPGTYTLTSDITIPSGVGIEGTSRDGVIIDCNGTYGVKLVGTDSYTTGDVTLANGDTTVVGTGTTWIVGMIGQYIFLDGYWYLISDVVSTTEITLDSAFFGSDLTNSGYAIATTNFNSRLRKLTITGATGSGLEVSYCNEPNLDDLVLYGNGVGIEMNYNYAPLMFVSTYENDINMTMDYTEAFEIRFSAFDFSTTGDGVVLTNCGNATIFDSSFAGNAVSGISLENSSNITLLSLDISNNTGDGIKYVSGNSFIPLNTVSFYDNGAYGINIVDGTTTNTILSSVTCSGNTSGSISDNGTGTLKSTAVNILP